MRCTRGRSVDIMAHAFGAHTATPTRSGGTVVAEDRPDTAGNTDAQAVAPSAPIVSDRECATSGLLGAILTVPGSCAGALANGSAAPALPETSTAGPSGRATYSATPPPGLQGGT